jgi:3-dehydroquinate dehydratase type I
MVKPIVVGLLTPQSWASIQEREVLQKCSHIEMRWDLFAVSLSIEKVTEAWTQILNEFPHKIWIWTMRLVRDGGAWPNDEAHLRLSYWEPFLKQQPEWLDLEWEEQSSLPSWRQIFVKSKILFSHHNFNMSYGAAKLEELYLELSNKSDGVELALTCRSKDELEELLALIKHLEQNPNAPLLAAFSMGDIGKKSRKLAPLLGAPWTYGITGAIAEAPGQIQILELLDYFKNHLQKGSNFVDL